MYPRRVRFQKDVLAEVYEPSRHNGKAVVIAGGMPSLPGSATLARFLRKKGYLVFVPRYRGSWESGGSFLGRSPHEDILDVVDGISQITIDNENFYQEKFTPRTYRNTQISVIGVSFGGTAALFCAADDRVSSAIAICPVVDWTAQSQTEPLDWLADFCRRSFGQGYRFSDEDWTRLSEGKIYSPADVLEKIDSEKLFVIHAMDDDVVSFDDVKPFVEKVGCKHLYIKKGGHLSSRVVTKWHVWRKVKGLL
ncbi:prolyl oligopeptidase family serine peptidase [Candidatus Nomurabacteria bacterium]|nr:prolyl oligopeptidase family serine peptidase [Candidatus Nomurabacteria bacterium]